MRILITGGAGFLGSHLCEAFIDRGDDVICLDNFSTGSSNNVAHIKAKKQFQLIEHNVQDPLDLSTDLIFNMACPASR